MHHSVSTLRGMDAAVLPRRRPTTAKPRNIGSKAHNSARKRPGSAPVEVGFRPGTMQVLGGGESVAQTSGQSTARPSSAAGRSFRPHSGRRGQCSRVEEDTRSLQVRRRQESGAAEFETGIVPPLPYIKADGPVSARVRKSSEMAERPDTDAFLASLDNSLAASREVFAAVPTNARIEGSSPAKASKPETASVSVESKPQSLADIEQEREILAYLEQNGLEEEATQSRQRLAALSDPVELLAEPEPAPNLTPDPGPEVPLSESKTALDDIEQSLQSLQEAQDRRRQRMDAMRASPRPEVDLGAVGMDELDRRLAALQETQDKRRQELDSYMGSLQTRKVPAEDGTTESLVEFPDGFLEIIQNMKREEMERPWLGYLEGGDVVAHEEETDEQRRNRRGLELMARLDKILAEKTKEAKRAAAYREFERRLEAEARGEEIEVGGRPAVAKKVDETMADTVGKLVRRSLGSTLSSRFITLSDERAARVEQILEKSDGASYYIDTGHNQIRIDDIDRALQELRPEADATELAIATTHAVRDSTGSAKIDSACGSIPDRVAASNQSTEENAEAERRAAARREATDYLRGAAVERKQKQRSKEIDSELRKMRTQDDALGVPWAGDPSKLDEMLSAATAELGTDAVTPLTDDQCKELCKIQPNFL